MIARLEGRLAEKTPTRVLVDVAGVGYEVFVPLSTFAALPDEGKTVALRIHTHVREDALQLFGFATPAERDVFELLIRISGVGPKLAQAILSGIEPGALVDAVRAGDAAALRAVPGVGLKTAQRIVVELRDRVDALAAEPEVPGRPAAAPGDAVLEDVISALANLGVAPARARTAAEAAVAALEPDAGVEALLREALRRLR